MKINSTLFREYDIRGRIDRDDELNPVAIDAISRGFAVFLRRRGIGQAVIGHDARPYSETVKDQVVEALLGSGIDIIEIGKVLVPMFYFSQYALRQKGGVMITASHNPWGWSGFKHAYDYSTTLVPADMKELQSIIEKEEFVQGVGRREIHQNIFDEYKKDVLARVHLERPMKVLVDTGNGTAGLFAPEILRQAGCQVVEQYTEVSDVRHHEANPSALGMLKAMGEGVKKNSADVGLGLDDDGDRIGAVDEKGQIIWPDRILALLARPILEKNKGAKIVFDVKCTQALIDDVVLHGGTPVIWKTGHSYIKAKSKEENAPLAGERSGHLFFRDGYYGYDDATFAALKLLEYMSRSPKSLSQLIGELPQYVTSPVWHAQCADTVKYALVDKLVEEFKREYGADKVVDVNGARVRIEGGWGLVRASSNVPALVLVFEAKTEEGLKKIENIFRAKLAAYPEVGSEWTSG
ncbi:MAG: phosphomannomutase/phosphoglucomutase [Candidatus Sungbacteria bacterium]|uniref:Phosphomannomutase/phosphoglucomutase n=1 Tax=Candidatus Sungiibacteriota bacterium TaxID=2750080 RepID=A0A932QZJ7_9BACT|nr:phosphomannomutase/phosphoglucomutase [Candidatus Sungbacteria bacterium]